MERKRKPERERQKEKDRKRKTERERQKKKDRKNECRFCLHLELLS